MSESEEFFYRENGKKKDSGLHDFILKNEKADRETAIASAVKAVSGGMEKSLASILYDVPVADISRKLR